MDYFREIVSKNKNRYKKDGFNLDLSYICPNIIAMAMPSTGFQSLYRNKIEEVSSLIKKNHESKFLIINASNIKYNYLHFDNKVVTMDWKDHLPCPFFHFLDNLILSIKFLLKDKKNTVVVHCIGGKGRTGSFINALLLFFEYFDSIDKCNKFYKEKRGAKVTNILQLKFLQRYENFLLKGISNLNYDPMVLHRIIMKSNVEIFKGYEFYFKIEDYDKNNIIFSDFIKVENLKKENELYIWESTHRTFWGDLNERNFFIHFYKQRSFGKELLGKIHFNLFFGKSNVFNIKSDNIQKKSFNIPKKFEISFIFKKIINDEKKKKWENKFKSYENIFKKLKKNLN